MVSFYIFTSDYYFRYKSFVYSLYPQVRVDFKLAIELMHQNEF